jgi:hypothetical protein
MSGGEVAAIRRQAADYLTADPQLLPAAVILAQTDVKEGDGESALKRLEPVVEELPLYTAAQLLVGHAGEMTGDLVVALTAYKAVAPGSAFARSRMDALVPSLLNQEQTFVEDALRRGYLEEANHHLAILEGLAPGEEVTLELKARLAREKDDRETELEALRELTIRRPDDDAALARRAMLEVDVGHPSAGLSIMETVVKRHPGDPLWEDELAAVKFLWRVKMLPTEVQDLVGQAELSRADFAVLLYWLVPGVRSGLGSHTQIASDILDHPEREAITRVVGLNLMQVDGAVHRFFPLDPVSRADAMASILRVLEQYNAGTACLEGMALPPLRSFSSVCSLAAQCGLIQDSGDCLPTAGLSGTEALVFIRRGVTLLSPS